MDMITAESVGIFIFLSSQLYTGVKIKARIMPTTIDIKIGRRIKNDKTTSIARIIVVITLLKNFSSIFLLLLISGNRNL
jgi:hypothetical protein